MATASVQQMGTTAIPQNFDIPDPQKVARLEGKVSDVEWQMRCDLAATYRLCALHGWTDLVFTHISARLPDENGEERILDENEKQDQIQAAKEIIRHHCQ